MALVNGDFETWSAGDPTGWTLTKGAGSTITQEAVIVHGGTSAAKFDSSLGNSCSLGQTMAVVVGTSYTSIAWYREAVFIRHTLLGGASNGWTLQADNSWAAPFAQRTPTSAGAYALSTITTNAVPAGVTGIFIEFGGGAPGTPAYFDDTSLTAVAAGGTSRLGMLLGVGT